MKTPLLLLLALTSFAVGQTTTPIFNGKLTGPLDANAQTIKSASSLSFGAVSPAAASAVIHILPNSSPTTAANGIKFGADTGIYRSANGQITVTGNLVVTGTIAGSEGIVKLAGANIFSGSNTFNGAVTISETATMNFASAFSVADGVKVATQTNLGLLPGTNVQAWSALLDAIAALNPQQYYFMVGTGSTWEVQGGSTVRNSLGLGTGNNVTFTNVTASGALAVTGTSTLTGKVQAAGAVSDATGLQLGTGGSFYGAGSDIVTDDSLTIKGNTVLGDNSADNVQVFGTLKLGNSNDWNLARTGTSTATITGNLVTTGTLQLGSALPVGSGGTGLTSLASNRFLVGTGSSAMSPTTITDYAMTLLAASTDSATRDLLGLGTAALKDTGTGSSNVILGNDSRLTDSRTPTGSAAGTGSDIEGTYPDAVTIKANAVALSTDTTGAYVQQLSNGTGVSITGTNNIEGAVPVISIGQSVATASSPTFASMSLTGSLDVASNYTSTNGNLTLTNGTLTLTNGNLVVTNGAITFPVLKLTTSLLPAVSGAADIGSSTYQFGNLFLASGGTINFNNGSVVLTNATTSLTVSTGDLRVSSAGTNAASVVTVAGAQTLTNKTLTAPTITNSTSSNATITILSLLPVADASAALGAAGQAFSDLYLGTGGTLNFGNSNVVLTHATGVLTVTTGDLRVSSAGTSSTSVATLNGSQTLANKTLTTPKIVDLGYIADANGNQMLVFDTVSSSVNCLTLANAAFSGSPTISAAGSDTNINITLTPKGSGTVVATNAITPTGGVAAAGGWSVSPRTVHSGNTPPNAALSSAGTDTTPVATTTYICEIFIPANCTVTGVAVVNGSANAGNIQVSLADSTGAPIAAAKSASTASSGANAYQRIPFASSYAAKGPATYYIMYQTDNTSNRLRTHLVGNFGTSTQTAGTYGTFVSFSPPTTFTTNVGPICSLY